MAGYQESPVRCRIDIISAGIGGLVAAVILRRAGHTVRLHELPRRTGICGGSRRVHITPNANSVLQSIGIDQEMPSTSILQLVRHYNSNGELLNRHDVKAESGRWQKLWLTAAFEDVMNQLEIGALGQRQTPSPIVAVDPNHCKIRLQGGTELESDVIICTSAITGPCSGIFEGSDVIPKPSAQTAALVFQFTIPRETVQKDSQAESFIGQLSSFDMFWAEDQLITVDASPTQSSLDFTCFQIREPLEVRQNKDVTRPTARLQLLETFKNFDASLLRVIEKVREGDLRVCSTADVRAPGPFTGDRIAVIETPSLPYLPHQMHSVAMAIEDGASLAVFLTELESIDEIPERLRLFASARQERIALIQGQTGLEQQVGEVSQPTTPNVLRGWNFREYLDVIFGHDEIHHSTQILRQYKWDKTPRLSWRQPVSFGPMTSPRQHREGDNLLNPRPDRLGSAKSLFASLRFRTSATLLRNLFPNAAYSFLKPDTVAEASFVFQGIENLSWLGGRGYNLVLFQIHGIRHQSGQSDVVRQGAYVPLVLEDLTDPIVSGRDDLGWPKLYSDIIITNRISTSGELSVVLSWRGNEWATFSWKGLQPYEQPPQQRVNNGDGENSLKQSQSSAECLFVHKYVSASGGIPTRKAADADYDVMMPPPSPAAGPVQWSHVAANATFQISRGAHSNLPTLWHIAERLAELPLMEVVDAKVGIKQGQDDFIGAERVS